MVQRFIDLSAQEFDLIPVDTRKIIGYEGENNATVLRIDLDEHWSSLVVRVEVSSNEGDYDTGGTQGVGTIEFGLSNIVTKAGVLSIALVADDGDDVKRTAIFRGYSIGPAIEETDVVPVDPSWKTWIESQLGIKVGTITTTTLDEGAEATVAITLVADTQNTYDFVFGIPRGDTGAQGIQGIQGIQGKEVEFQKTETHIQWRYVGETLWNNLVALSDIKGEQGIQGIQGEKGDPGELTQADIESQKNIPEGLAGLDENGKISPDSLPSNILLEYTVPVEIGAEDVLVMENLDIKAGDTVELIVESINLTSGAGLYFPESEQNWITISEFFYIGVSENYPIRCNIFFGKNKITSNIFMDFVISGTYQYLQFHTNAPNPYPENGITSLILYTGGLVIPAGTKIWLIRR